MRQFVFVILLLILPTFGESQDIAIEDLDFLSALIEDGIDQNGDGLIQIDEALTVDSLELRNREIKSIVGIHEFKNLLYLSLANNKIKSISIDQLNQLQKLVCTNNELENIELHCEELHFINAERNKLINFSVAGLPKLITLSIDESVMVIDMPDPEPGPKPNIQEQCYDITKLTTSIVKHHVREKDNRWSKHHPQPRHESYVIKRWTRTICEKHNTPRLSNLLLVVMDSVRLSQKYYGSTSMKNQFIRYQRDKHLPVGQIDINTMIHLGILKPGEEDEFLKQLEYQHAEEESKMNFDLEAIDRFGLVHMPRGEKANRYSFLIPNEDVYKKHVISIDTSIVILPDSLQAVMIEHAGQDPDMVFCSGRTQQVGIRSILLKLAAIKETKHFTVFYSEPLETK